MSNSGFITTPEMADIISRVEPLEDAFERERKPMTDHARSLNKRIGRLMAQLWEISATVNRRWHAQAPVWKNSLK